MRTDGPPAAEHSPLASFRHDLLPSFVVFLVALPLCMGIAVASGMPVASGLITGIVGGILVGLVGGAPLQVSGPAAGLTVIVFVLVERYGFEMLGVAVLASVVLLALRINLRHVGPALDIGAGFLSGVLNTSLSTNGPPLVFVLQSRHLEPPAFRGTISQVFAFSNMVGLTLFVVAGKVTSDGVVTAAVALPALILGQVAGFPLRRHVHGERFRWLVLVLLTAAAVSAIVSALA